MAQNHLWGNMPVKLYLPVSRSPLATGKTGKDGVMSNSGT